MQLLHRSPVPVSQSLALIQCGDTSYHLRGYGRGEPLSVLLKSDERMRGRCRHPDGEAAGLDTRRLH